jgi:hypothetical protein
MGLTILSQPAVEPAHEFVAVDGWHVNKKCQKEKIKKPSICKSTKPINSNNYHVGNPLNVRKTISQSTLFKLFLDQRPINLRTVTLLSMNKEIYDV